MMRIADLFKTDRSPSMNGTAVVRGSGLGLLLCRNVVERMGGALTVASSVGDGTLISFILGGAQRDAACADPSPQGSHAKAI